MELLPSEEAWCEIVGVSKEMALVLKEVTGNAIESAARTSWDTRQPPHLAALSSVGPPIKLENLRGCLTSEYSAYYGQRRHPNGGREDLELLVTHDLDPLFMVRGRLTDGCHYEVSHEDIISKLEDWQARFGIDVLGADHDFVELRFLCLPANLVDLAEEIYWFCPSITEPDGNGRTEGSNPELFARAQELPEPSAEFFKRLNREYAEIMGREWELKNAPGLRLLAAQLERDSTVYLWWD